MNQSLRYASIALLTVALGIGCSAESHPIGSCKGNVYHDCEDGACPPSETCTGDTPLCDASFGCVACAPGGTTCVGSDVHECTPDGTTGVFLESCTSCDAGACLTDCELAAQNDSYLGCEFMAVTTLNSLLHTAFDGDFAVVVGNPDSSRWARIHISRDSKLVANREIPPGGSEAIRLPMIDEVTRATESGVISQSAYEVTSDLPVMAYQFNPLHFAIRSLSIVESLTNDASLLLPVHSYDREYRIDTQPTFGTRYPNGSVFAWDPAFTAIVATEDATEVVFTRPNDLSVDGGLTFGSNDKATVTLQRGDVLQVLTGQPEDDEQGNVCANNDWPQELAEGNPVIACSATPYDLTGAVIETDKPVGVFAGHSCTFAPISARACDHLEEMVLPINRWGDSTVMTAPAHPDGLEFGTVPAQYTVLADEDDTTLTLTPAVLPPTTLGAGESISFETDQDFEITANRPFLAHQMLLSQLYLDSEVGDPAVGIGVPLFQVRGSYNFLTPSTFTRHFVNIVATGDAPISVNDKEVVDWVSIEGTNYRVARVPLPGGAHTARSAGDSGFSIVVYGYAPYTSYLYPGGLSLRNFLE